MRDLAQHITDLVENSTRAGASRVAIELDHSPTTGRLVLRLSDDGCGMPVQAAARATDPFFTSRTCRRVGLGLPLLAAAAERCGGHLEIRTLEGKGTVVEVEFLLDHIDLPPIGDLGATLMCAVVGHSDVEFYFRYTVDNAVFELDTAAVQAELGDLPLSHPSVIRWLERYTSEGLATVGTVTAQ